MPKQSLIDLPIEILREIASHLGCATDLGTITYAEHLLSIDEQPRERSALVERNTTLEHCVRYMVEVCMRDYGHGTDCEDIFKQAIRDAELNDCSGLELMRTCKLMRDVVLDGEMAGTSESRCEKLRSLRKMEKLTEDWRHKDLEALTKKEKTSTMAQDTLYMSREEAQMLMLQSLLESVNPTPSQWGLGGGT